MNLIFRLLVLFAGTAVIVHSYLFEIPVFMYPLTLTAFVFCYYAVVYKRAKSEVVTLATPKKVVFIIPCYNDYPEVISTLMSVHRAMSLVPNPWFEIFVIDDGSTDDMATEGHETVKTLAHLIVKGKNSGSKARAMQSVYDRISSDTDFVVVLDSDTILDENAMVEALCRFELDPKMMAACGCIVPKSRKGLLGKMQYGEIMGNYGVLKRVQAQTGNVMVLAGAFSIHRYEVFRKVGYWEDWIVEDICWTWRARIRGVKIGYLDAAVAYTGVPKDFGWLFRQRRRWARGRVEAAKVVYKEKGWKGLATVSPWLFTAFMEAFAPIALILCFIADFSMALMYVSLFNLIATVFAVEFKEVIKPVIKEGGVYGRFKYEGGEFSYGLYGFLLNLYIFPAVILGFADEIFKRPKSWLTNGDKF